MPSIQHACVVRSLNKMHVRTGGLARLTQALRLVVAVVDDALAAALAAAQVDGGTLVAVLAHERPLVQLVHRACAAEAVRRDVIGALGAEEARVGVTLVCKTRGTQSQVQKMAQSYEAIVNACARPVGHVRDRSEVCATGRTCARLVGHVRDRSDMCVSQ